MGEQRISHMEQVQIIYVYILSSKWRGHNSPLSKFVLHTDFLHKSKIWEGGNITLK